MGPYQIYRKEISRFDFRYEDYAWCIRTKRHGMTRIRVFAYIQHGPFASKEQKGEKNIDCQTLLSSTYFFFFKRAVHILRSSKAFRSSLNVRAQRSQDSNSSPHCRPASVVQWWCTVLICQIYSIRPNKTIPGLCILQSRCSFRFFCQLSKLVFFLYYFSGVGGGAHRWKCERPQASSVMRRA